MAKHFLHISDYNTDQIWEILHLSKELKTKFHNKENFKPFRDRSLAMIFAKHLLEQEFHLKQVLNGWGGRHYSWVLMI